MNIKKLQLTHLLYQDYLVRFKAYATQIGYSIDTGKQIVRSLKEFFYWLEGEGIEAIEIIDSKTIKSFYVYLQSRPNPRNREGVLSQSHIVSILYGVKVFYQYLFDNQAVSHSPFDSLQFPRTQYVGRESMSRSQIQALYDACESLFEKAFLSLYYGCGLRLREGINLQIHDLRLSEGVLYVTQGKGKKRRVVPLSGQVMRDLMAYYQLERPQVANTAFLLNRKRKALDVGTANKFFKRLLARADLSPHYGLHHLRHSIATHLLENGMKVEQVGDFLGHSCLESTQIYAKVSLEHILKTL